MSIVVWVFGWVGRAWGGDASPEMTFDAQLIGDLDCSGARDMLVLYSIEGGDILMELTLDAPTEGLEELASSSKEGASVDIVDIDGDKCDDLIVAGDSETTVLFGGDLGWLVASDERGAGTDIQIIYRPSSGDISIGADALYGKEYMVCEEWVTVLLPCGFTLAGPVLCPYQICVRWRHVVCPGNPSCSAGAP